ncbi:hypothetical protein DL96DRAFT_1812139 [Flagelloscypha sp. PMI_526]|nr:hypothetical protein DL96DRAFT_1812139 [Flagelloscypha sp. PMI_526]
MPQPTPTANVALSTDCCRGELSFCSHINLDQTSFSFLWVVVGMSISHHPPPSGTGLRFLSFDGGGIQAVSQALMVREMIHRIEADHPLSSPARVCDHFDMICGSGFGGLLAIMCGILKMTGDELVQEFVGLCKTVFSEDLDKAQRTVLLENEIKRLIRTYSTGGEERRMIDSNDKCKTFVCAASFHNTDHPRLFRNYVSRTNPSQNCMIWEAALATMANPELFEPIVIGSMHLGETFVAGTVRWNNPTDELTKEAARVFKDHRVACIISIGSGHPGHTSLARGLSELFSRIALDCERVADDMDHRFGNTKAFWRLSVEQGLQNLEGDMNHIDALVCHTHSYLQSVRTTRSIDALLQDLVQRPERIPVERISDMPPPTHRAKSASFMVIGGGGKTQIGLEFIQQNRDQFSDVFFIDASSKITLEHDLKAIAFGVSDKPTVADGLRILQENKEEWLLFLDNADDTTLDLRPYILWPHGNVLITTRNREVRVHAPECNIWVDKLELEEAKILLLRGLEDSESLEARQAASGIVQELGCLALAVNQARGYLAQGICTLSEYLALFRQNRWKLLEDKTVQATDDYQHTVYTTWTISFNRLSPNAASFLELLCFMHHAAIPSKLFENAWKYIDEMGANGVPTTLVGFLSNFRALDSTWDILRFRTLVREILSFSLIEFNPSNSTFSLHPLVQQWARSQSWYSEEAIRSTQTLLCLATPLGHSRHDYAMRISLLPHIRSSTETGLDVDYTFLRRIGLVYRHGGLWQESFGVYKQELSEIQKQLGTEHPATLRSMSELASAYSDLGQHREGLELYEQVLALRRLNVGEEHPDTLVTMNNLAIIYSVLGRYPDAVKLKEQVLALRSQNLGEEHPDTLVSMNNLAVTYAELGQYQNALKLQERGLALERRILGEEHPDTLMSLGNLADTYADLGQNEDALALKQQVLALRTRILGENHPDTLVGMGNLAMTHSDLGEFQDALTLEKRVLALRIQVLGKEHPDTLSAMANLASTYSHLGQKLKARELKEQVLALRKQILGENHPNTLLAMSNLAFIYSDLGQPQDALRL